MTTSACGVPGCTRCMQRYPSQTCQWSCHPADLHFHSPLANMPWFAEGDCGFRFGWFCWSNDICFVLHKKTIMWNCETIKIWSKCPPPQWIFPVESWLGKSCFPSKTEFFAVSRCVLAMVGERTVKKHHGDSNHTLGGPSSYWLHKVRPSYWCDCWYLTI